MPSGARLSASFSLEVDGTFTAPATERLRTAGESVACGSESPRRADSHRSNNLSFGFTRHYEGHRAHVMTRVYTHLCNRLQRLSASANRVAVGHRVGHRVCAAARDVAESRVILPADPPCGPALSVVPLSVKRQVGQSGRRPAAAHRIVGQSGRRPAAAHRTVLQSGRRPAAAHRTVRRKVKAS